MRLPARLRRTTERINALSLRERALLLLAALAVAFLLWDLFVMQPIAERRDTATSRLEQTGERVGHLNQAIRELATASSNRPQQALELEAEALEQTVAELESELRDRIGGIATPRQSVEVLASLVSDRTGVRLVELNNLPPERLGRAGGETVPGIYVHPVRIVVEADFSSLQRYLAGVAELPDGVFWRSMRLSVPGWPTNRVELVLYSLALDDHWLGV